MTEFVTTRTALGTTLLHVEHFIFRRNKVVVDKTYWSCEESCGATCSTVDGSIVAINNEHSHAPDLHKSNRLMTLEKMKTLLDQNSLFSLRSVYDRVMVDLRSGSAVDQYVAGKNCF